MSKFYFEGYTGNNIFLTFHHSLEIYFDNMEPRKNVCIENIVNAGIVSWLQ